MTILIFSLFHTTGFTLSSDKDQPAEIESDEVDVDFTTGRRTFIGNVRFIQGTLRVKADRLVAFFEDGKLANATAYGEGNLAAFRQLPDGKKNDVEGRGRTIVMNQTENTLTLKKQASLKQGPDVARGDNIFYNMATDKLRILGNTNIKTKDTSAKKTKPKTQTDSFFNEPIKPLTSDVKPKKAPVKSTTSSTQAEQSASTEQAEATTDFASKQDELPKELVLPGQSTTTTEKSSSGRSRLIILPKSK